MQSVIPMHRIIATGAILEPVVYLLAQLPLPLGGLVHQALFE